MRTGEIDLSQLDFPLTLRPNVPISDEELLSFSARNAPWRIESNGEGEIIIMTPVTGMGGANEAYVFRIFTIWAEQDGRGVDFSPNTGFKLKDGATLSPDIAWLPLERWNTLTPVQKDSFVPFCPDFLIEVRSKSDRRRIVEEKMLRWMENDVQLAWLVDPIDATVTIYRPNLPTQTLERPDVVHGDPPVAGFQLPCTRLWPAL